MLKMESFLSGVQLRPVTLPSDSPFQPLGLALGGGTPALEVLVVTSASPPRVPQIRNSWRARHGGRPAPLLLVVLHGGRAALCGPAGDEPTVFEQVDLGQAERMAREALAQPDRHAALRLLRDALPSVKTRLPGVRNEGFLATHELEVGARSHRAWIVADAKARPALKQRGEPLLAALGFRIERADQNTSILRTTAAGRKVAIAVLLNQSESPELVTDRFNGLSPVSYALTVAERERLPYVVVLQGAKVRLYPVEIGVGVGRRGRTETYLEIHTGLIRDIDAAYLWLLFSAEALDEGGTLADLLAESQRFAGNLAENLRDRIYNFVVPPLATGLAKARGFRKPTPADLAVTYEMAMTVLFRLLFIAYGEDKDLLPYKWNSLYQARSLKHKAQELLELVCGVGVSPASGPAGRLHHNVDCLEPARLETLFDEGDSLWEEISRLFVAVAEGHREWGIPSYDGGLFSAEADVSRAGSLLADIRLPNKVVGPVLANLLLIGTPEGIGPVDFRSLGVREFGTIYEGLLESELAVAETDLGVDDNGYYRPCREGEEAVVTRRHIYLHNRSGARKATGAYFTKQFAVEHLLGQALEPALAEHFARLDKLDDDLAAEQLFDFRVADIAMGSGHFLVAAVDHIERAMSQYLARRPLPGVRQELAQLYNGPPGAGPVGRFRRDGRHAARAAFDRPALAVRRGSQSGIGAACAAVDLDSHVCARPAAVAVGPQPGVRQFAGGHCRRGRDRRFRRGGESHAVPHELRIAGGRSVGAAQAVGADRRRDTRRLAQGTQGISRCPSGGQTGRGVVTKRRRPSSARASIARRSTRWRG
jgi:hypothetical protein